MMLKNNFDEFKDMVPQSGLRIKIKSLIDAETNYSTTQVQVLCYICLLFCIFICVILCKVFIYKSREILIQL